MELRSCSHLHFIQAVKRGLVVNTLNVNRGRPTLKFKALEDIYETLEAKNQNLIFQPEAEFDSILFDSNRVEIGGPSTGTLAKRILISDPDASEFSCSDDDQRNSDVDDPGFDEMTLKQIKENCKEKKRKRSKSVDFRIPEMSTRIKQETDEDECDLMEPIITWKSKGSKKVKAKSKCLRNHVSTPSDFIKSKGSLPAPINIKVEVPEPDFSGHSSLLYDNQVDSCRVVQREMTEIGAACDLGIQALCSDGQNSISFLVDSCGVIHREEIEIGNENDPVIQDSRGDPGTQVLCSDGQNAISFLVDSCGIVHREEIEIGNESDPGSQDSQNAICLIGDSSLVYDSPVDSCGVEPREGSEIIPVSDRETQELTSLTREPQYFVVSEVYHEYLQHSIPQPFQIVDSLVDSCVVVPKEMTEPTTECVMGTQKLICLTEEPQYCVVNKACFENMEHDYSEPVQILSASCDSIKKVDIPEISNQGCSELSVSESKGEGDVDQPFCADTFQEPMLSISASSFDKHDDFPSPSTNHAIPCNIESNTKVPIPAVAIHGCLQHTESIHRSEANVPDNAKDDSPSNLETNALHGPEDKYNSGPDSCFAPIDESPTTEDEQSQRSSDADAETVCSPEIVHHDASEELAISDGGENYHYSDLNRPPQRLLSTRKAISPDSQEKLCQAVKSIELHDEEHYRPRKKLCLGQQTGKKIKITATERSGQIARVRFSVNHKQNPVKPKNEKRLAQTEGDHKDPHVSNAAPRFSTGCTSIETCSQSAIAFSQRQMQDIECLATKLTNELKTMKEIAEDRFLYESCPATSVKYKANEVRMAIKNANKVEQLANRWLSIMARDCSRFCKIMRMTENESSAPESETVVNKERKKITFADEAGEELCHVRFFKNDFPSSLEPDTENPEVVN